MPRTVLFLCTGNYYRSRFAEHLFNHLARQGARGYAAESRALALERGACNIGPISAHTLKALQERGVSLAAPERAPLPCCEQDLAAAHLVIALKEAEHRPLLQQRFPGWEDRVEYWHVHDLDQSGPSEALGDIALSVARLVASLGGEEESPLQPKDDGRDAAPQGKL